MRLEACKDPSGLPLIHCYGHQEKGAILSWGCAADTLDLVKRTVKDILMDAQKVFEIIYVM